MNNKFNVCFPISDGMMLCQHLNGNWVKFPISRKKTEEKENHPQQEDDFQPKE